jgi:hypothetical protein
MRSQLQIVLVLGAFVPVIGQGAPGPGVRQPATSSTGMPSGRVAGESKKPYEKLFSIDQVPSGTAPEPGKNTSPPLTMLPGTDAADQKIVCGLTVWNVGPALDPRMVMRAPANSRQELKIKKIAPTVCAE